MWVASIRLRLVPCVKCGWEIYKSQWTGVAVCSYCDYDGLYLRRWIREIKESTFKEINSDWETYEERVASGRFYPKTLIEQLFGPRGSFRYRRARFGGS